MRDERLYSKLIMKNRYIPILCLQLFLVIVSVEAASYPEKDAVDQLLRLTGKAYRERVDSLIAIPGVRFVLKAPSASLHVNLLSTIVEQRSSHRNVFNEYSEYVRSQRQNMKSQQPIGARPGFIAGSLVAFARRGVESLDIEEHVGWEKTPYGMVQQTQTVRKHTEEDVSNGRARNKAARIAILEHFLKFAVEGSAYEQRELVETVVLLWGAKNDDGIPVEALLEELAQDETRDPSVRAAAMAYLPVGKRKGEREIMLMILQSPETKNETECNGVVRQAIDHLKQHDFQALKGIRSDIYWKQVLISEALNLPVPPEPEASPNSEAVIDIRE